MTDLDNQELPVKEISNTDVIETSNTKVKENSNKEVENIIKLQEMLGQTEQETKDEYKNFVLSKFNVKMCYPLLTPAFSHDKINQIVEKANNLKINTLIALPGYVEYINKNINNLNIGVGVVLGYPYGEDGVNALVNQIKLWSKQNVSEVIAVLSLRDMLYNSFKGTDKILKKLVSIRKKKIVGVMLDFSILTEVDKEKIIKKIATYNIDKLYLSTAQEEDIFREDLIELSKKLITKKVVQVVSSVRIENESEITLAVKKADMVLTAKSLDFLEEVKSKINL